MNGWMKGWYKQCYEATSLIWPISMPFAIQIQALNQWQVFSEVQTVIKLEKICQIYFILTISLQLTKIFHTLNCSRNVARKLPLCTVQLGKIKILRHFYNCSVTGFKKSRKVCINKTPQLPQALFLLLPVICISIYYLVMQ